MALSGSRNFTLKVHEIIREAAEKAGGGRLNGEDLKSYVKSINLVYQDVLNKGIPLALICQWVEPLYENQQEYNLGNCLIDIHSATIKGINTNDAELGIKRVSYGEFNQIPRKTTTGRPTVFMTERQWNNLMVRVWPLPDRDYDLSMYVFVKPDDMFKYTDDIRIQPRFLPVFIAGLAYEIAIMRELPLDRLAFLKQDYDEKLVVAQKEDRERVTLRVLPNLR